MYRVWKSHVAKVKSHRCWSNGRLTSRVTAVHCACHHCHHDDCYFDFCLDSSLVCWCHSILGQVSKLESLGGSLQLRPGLQARISRGCCSWYFTHGTRMPFLSPNMIVLREPVQYVAVSDESHDRVCSVCVCVFIVRRNHCLLMYLVTSSQYRLSTLRQYFCCCINWHVVLKHLTGNLYNIDCVKQSVRRRVLNWMWNEVKVSYTMNT